MPTFFSLFIIIQSVGNIMIYRCTTFYTPFFTPAKYIFIFITIFFIKSSIDFLASSYWCCVAIYVFILYWGFEYNLLQLWPLYLVIIIFKTFIDIIFYWYEHTSKPRSSENIGTDTNWSIREYPISIFKKMYVRVGGGGAIWVKLCSVKVNSSYPCSI